MAGKYTVKEITLYGFVVMAFTLSGFVVVYMCKRMTFFLLDAK